MIISSFSNGFNKGSLISLLMLVPIVLISLTFHEVAHGYVAYLCGDKTARNFGRLTLNPIKHLDLVGALMMLIIGFGWAKPVPINPRNFKNFKRDLVLVSIAGPLSNFVLAFIAVILLVVFNNLLNINFTSATTSSQIIFLIYYFFSLFATLNIGLGLFNLIPIPPLDGSRILSVLLPARLSIAYNKIEDYTRYIFLGLILLSYIPFNIGPFNSVSDLIFYPLEWAREGILEFMFYIVSIPF